MARECSPETDEARRAEIDRIAAILDRAPVTGEGGHQYRVVRHFGPISYDAVALSAAFQSSYRAHMAGWSRGHE